VRFFVKAFASSRNVRRGSPRSTPPSPAVSPTRTPAESPTPTWSLGSSLPVTGLRRERRRSVSAADAPSREGVPHPIGNCGPRVHRRLDCSGQPRARSSVCPATAYSLPTARRHAARLSSRATIRVTWSSAPTGRRLLDLLPSSRGSGGGRPRAPRRTRL